MGWTPERVARLKELYELGWTGTEIANDLRGGVSRVAVVAKLNRMGLKRGRPTAPEKKTPSKTPVAKKRAQTKKPPIPKAKTAKRPPAEPPMPDDSRAGLAARIQAAATANPDARGVPITELGRRECRWPVGTDPRTGDHLFCGAPTEHGQSYCGRHAAHAVAGKRRQQVSKPTLDGFLDHIADKGARRAAATNSW